jgi:hypothetical protein
VERRPLEPELVRELREQLAEEPELGNEWTSSWQWLPAIPVEYGKPRENCTCVPLSFKYQANSKLGSTRRRESNWDMRGKRGQEKEKEKRGIAADQALL